MIHQNMRILRNISVFKLLCKASFRKGVFEYGIKAVSNSLLLKKKITTPIFTLERDYTVKKNILKKSINDFAKVGKVYNIMKTKCQIATQSGS